MGVPLATGIPLATPRARAARARILQLSRERRADPDYLRELSANLRTLIPFDGVFLAAADPLTALATSPARVESLANVPDMCRIWWESEFLTEDFLRFGDLARAPQPAASLYRATDGRPGRSGRWRAVRDALGFSDELRAVFRTGYGAWAFVSLWRREDAPRFSPAEEKLLADLSEVVAQPFRRAALLPEIPPEPGIDAPGLLMLNGAGVLESLNEQAEAWLAELPQPAVTGRDGERILPTELLTVSARARAIAAGLDSGVARARIQTLGGRWLVIHGFALRTAAGVSDQTALVIQPARPSEVASIIVGAYELTLREQQITRLISRGLATDEIAHQLGLSPHTVRDHLKQIFAKARVSSRGELVAKVYADHYGPRLDAGILTSMIGDAAEGATETPRVV
jgi:DNA-binding CsgD family transcriptional regulator